MKNVILIQFLFFVLTSSRNLYGQHYQIRDVQHLRAVGFNIGEPVRIGTFEDQPFNRALVEGKEKKQLWKNKSGDSEGKPGRCVKGVGCCC
ncbi:MAG: hypothetical protein N2050_11610 [Flavobacteriales bacterium]|nr:hypothetical protein [Flavobacteriales bacterium]